MSGMQKTGCMVRHVKRLCFFLFFFTASHLRLGDEILAVNGYPLQDLAHAQAVQKLRGAGPTVILRVKPNQTLEGRTI